MTLPNIDPSGLFGVAGKSAVIVGATGAFGKVACATLGRAGGRLTIAAGNAGELNALKDELEAAGVKVAAIARRPNSETDCDTIVSIVFTSSARGKLGHPAGYSAYCTSKSAVDGMTKALGCEWGKYGITVNAIAPTVFRSPLTAWMFADDEKAKAVRAGFLARVPMGRLGEPEDLAGPLLFLCSRASDFHTGHILYADGGYTAG
jgi:NAD(P)-dependent dehydrogenase (short-subunit alcohol dehydrogenase family)